MIFDDSIFCDKTGIGKPEIKNYFLSVQFWFTFKIFLIVFYVLFNTSLFNSETCAVASLVVANSLSVCTPPVACTICRRNKFKKNFNLLH